MAKFGDKATTAKERSLDKPSSSLLLKICQTYDNLAAVDKLSAVSKKVDSVKLVMQENVDIALQNCVKLESIEKAAAELQQQAGVFKRNANELKKKMWWKNIKVSAVNQPLSLLFIVPILPADEAHHRRCHPGNPRHHHRNCSCDVQVQVELSGSKSADRRTTCNITDALPLSHQG